jgi:hypothetical protein
LIYSVLKLFTGFAKAAFIVWVLIVKNAITRMMAAGRINNPALIGILKA